MGKRDKEFYEKQIKFYMRQIEFDSHSIEHCNRMMKYEKSYYGLETVEYDKLKKERAKHYRERRHNKKQLEKYQKLATA